MEFFLSAVLGDLASRSTNFIINKCSKLPSLAVEDSLQRALLRAQVIVNESMRRRITNQAMLQQLNMLRDTMHRGNYMLDTFRCQANEEKDDAKHKIVSQPLLLYSKVNCVRDLFFSSTTSAEISKEMKEVLDSLSSMIHDANELVLFLASCPPMYRQPYSMHLLLGNCMFGRQMETQFVINFLLHTQTHGAEELEVLPIIGPFRVGKSTLVANVCKDTRVRNHFSEVVFCSDHDFREEKLTTPREGHAKIFQNFASNKDGRILVIVELARDFNEGVWKRLYSAYKRCLPSGSKIIVTSQSDKVVKFGTTGALTLRFLSQEAYWYVFKTLTFGSMDPEMHPRLTQLAMEISRMHNCSLNGAYSTSHFLRENFDIHFWCKVLILLKKYVQKHLSEFGEHPHDLMNQNRPVQLGIMATPSEVIMVSHQYHCFSEEDVPKIRFYDVMYRNVRPHGKFEALVWRSQIPPYYSYAITCEIRELKTTGTKRKRTMKDGVTFY